MYLEYSRMGWADSVTTSWKYKDKYLTSSVISTIQTAFQSISAHFSSSSIHQRLHSTVISWLGTEQMNYYFAEVEKIWVSHSFPRSKTTVLATVFKIFSTKKCSSSWHETWIYKQIVVNYEDAVNNALTHYVNTEQSPFLQMFGPLNFKKQKVQWEMVLFAWLMPLSNKIAKT